jgi:hypothetical protein
MDGDFATTNTFRVLDGQKTDIATAMQSTCCRPVPFLADIAITAVMTLAPIASNG